MTELSIVLQDLIRQLTSTLDSYGVHQRRKETLLADNVKVQSAMDEREKQLQTYSDFFASAPDKVLILLNEEWKWHKEELFTSTQALHEDSLKILSDNKKELELVDNVMKSQHQAIIDLVEVLHTLIHQTPEKKDTNADPTC